MKTCICSRQLEDKIPRSNKMSCRAGEQACSGAAPFVINSLTSPSWVWGLKYAEQISAELPEGLYLQTGGRAGAKGQERRGRRFRPQDHKLASGFCSKCEQIHWRALSRRATGSDLHLKRTVLAAGWDQTGWRNKRMAWTSQAVEEGWEVIRSRI